MGNTNTTGIIDTVSTIPLQGSIYAVQQIRVNNSHCLFIRAYCSSPRPDRMETQLKFLVTRNSTELNDDEGPGLSSSLPSCTQCGRGVRAERWNTISTLCLDCGDKFATQQRASWCVVQTYGKGPYMLVTPESAYQTLKDTNQKAPRS